VRLKGLFLALLCWCGVFLQPIPAQAHDIPRTQIELRTGDKSIEATITFSVLGFALDYPAINLGPAEREAVAKSHQETMARAVTNRFVLRGASGGEEPENIVFLPERDAIRFQISYVIQQKQIEIQTGKLFPVDPNHIVFLSIYDRNSKDLVCEAILNKGNPNFTYIVGNESGKSSLLSVISIISVVGQFIREGIHHIFIGPDHILFVIGLLLLGGSFRQLLKIVTTFTLAHSITLVLATLNILNPSPHFIEPTIALSIIFVGIHSLIKSKNDMRLPLAFCFGLIHGFGFASVLQELELPRAALGWSLLSFNIGVEIGQACIVLVVTLLLRMIAQKSERAHQIIITVGAWAVVLAGSYWFGGRLLS
jgi:hydrogenase/urease accessory protein HupE